MATGVFDKLFTLTAPDSGEKRVLSSGNSCRSNAA